MKTNTNMNMKMNTNMNMKMNASMNTDMIMICRVSGWHHVMWTWYDLNMNMHTNINCIWYDTIWYDMIPISIYYEDEYDCEYEYECEYEYDMIWCNIMKCEHDAVWYDEYCDGCEYVGYRMIWDGMIWYQYEYVMSWPLDHIRYLIIRSGTRIRIAILIIRYMCLTHSLMRPHWSFLLGGVREARDGRR